MTKTLPLGYTECGSRLQILTVLMLIFKLKSSKLMLKEVYPIPRK